MPSDRNRASTAQWKKIRKDILERDQYACQKCGRRDTLQVHHIHAVWEGGEDDPANLITLCNGCHREWEMVESSLHMSHEQWLPLPPASRILAVLSQPDTLPADMSAKDWYAAFMATCQVMKDLRAKDPIGKVEEDE